MFHYSAIQWLFFFYLYCFLGWCFESTYVSIRTKKLVNRGFMRGPFLPLYGSGAIMMFVVSMPFRENVVLTYFAGVVGATILEYVTGVTMEALFKVRYWDYSNKRFNFQGHICLGSSIAWGFLTILMTRVIHKPIEKMVFSIPGNVLNYVTIFLTIYIVADFTLAFKAAMDLRDILIKMERAKEELERLQKRLDVIIAFNNEEREMKKQEREVRIGELVSSLEQRFAELKDTVARKPAQYSENVREELSELRAKLSLYVERQKYLQEALDFYKRSMIRNNPMMVSKKFKSAFEELKSIVRRED